MVTSREEIHEAMKKMKMGRTPEQDWKTSTKIQGDHQGLFELAIQ
jgi:hypothetical protein